MAIKVAALMRAVRQVAVTVIYQAEPPEVGEARKEFLRMLSDYGYSYADIMREEMPGE